MGITDSVQIYDFEILFDKLVTEILDDKNNIKSNMDILGNYYTMAQVLEWSFKDWYQNGGEESSMFERMDDMHCSIYNECQVKFLRLIEMHAPESIDEIDFEKKLSIQSYLTTITENNAQKNRILTLKPTYKGITIDLHVMWEKFINVFRK